MRVQHLLFLNHVGTLLICHTVHVCSVGPSSKQKIFWGIPPKLFIILIWVLSQQCWSHLIILHVNWYVNSGLRVTFAICYMWYLENDNFYETTIEQKFVRIKILTTCIFQFVPPAELKVRLLNRTCTENFKTILLLMWSKRPNLKTTKRRTLQGLYSAHKNVYILFLKF